MSQFHVFYTMPIFKEFTSKIRTTLDNTSVSKRGKVQIKDCEQFLPLQDFFDANNKGVCAEEPREWLRSLKATDLSLYGPGVIAPVYGAVGAKASINRDEAEAQIAASPALQLVVDRRAAALVRKNKTVDLSTDANDHRPGGSHTPHSKRQRRSPPEGRNKKGGKSVRGNKVEDRRATTSIFVDFWRKKSTSTTGSNYVQCAFVRLLRSEKCTKMDDCEKYNKFTHGKKLLAKDIMSAGQVRGTIASFIKQYGRLPEGPFSRVMPTYLPKSYRR